MSRRFPPFSLLGRSIRHKVVLGVIFCLLGFGGLGGMGYYYLTQIIFTLHLSSDMDDLNADVAEARHSERQYFKYGQSEELMEALGHVDKAMQRLDSILHSVKQNRRMKISSQDKILLSDLHVCLQNYRQFLSILPPDRGASLSQGGQAAFLSIAEARAFAGGEDVADKTRLLVLQLRDDQIVMVESLQWQLCQVMLALLALALVGGWLTVRRILRGLDIIADATRRIGQGDFTPLCLFSTEEETGQVITAINQMVGELEKRQRKLEQERKLASLGVLTAGIAHQLNNPLNNIYTTCQLLHEGAQEAGAGLRAELPLPEVEQKMDIVLQEVRRSRHIIRGLLDFSRESCLCAVPCALADVVHHALKLAAPHFSAQTRVEVHVPGHIVLPLDAMRFQEACLNLLINAAEALGDRSGHIRITASEDDEYVYLHLEDSGDGIAPEHLAMIFDPFFTSKSMGTGLGLSVAFGIVRKHGGSISAVSVQGQGSTFSIRLPRQQQSVQEVCS